MAARWQGFGLAERLSINHGARRGLVYPPMAVPGAGEGREGVGEGREGVGKSRERIGIGYGKAGMRGGREGLRGARVGEGREGAREGRGRAGHSCVSIVDRIIMMMETGLPPRVLGTISGMVSD